MLPLLRVLTLIFSWMLPELPPPSPKRADDVCSICHDPVETDAYEPACGHIHHRACVMPWIYAHAECPYCRAPIKAAMSIRPSEFTFVNDKNVAEGMRNRFVTVGALFQHGPVEIAVPEEGDAKQLHIYKTYAYQGKHSGKCYSQARAYVDLDTEDVMLVMYINDDDKDRWWPMIDLKNKVVHIDDDRINKNLFRMMMGFHLDKCNIRSAQEILDEARMIWEAREGVVTS